MIQKIQGQRYGVSGAINSVNQPEMKTSKKELPANHSSKIDTIEIGRNQKCQEG